MRELRNILLVVGLSVGVLQGFIHSVPALRGGSLEVEAAPAPPPLVPVPDSACGPSLDGSHPQIGLLQSVPAYAGC